ncbi:conserved hypothetical protein [Verrucomicrobia bacterium]|nr:conserved hypothetical protein [Verrucomicrobiota bacterium]
MQTVTLDEAQKHLPELVRKLSREGELLITDSNRPVARLIPAAPQPSIHPEVAAITGLVPSEGDAEEEHRRYLRDKHR